MAEPFKNLFNPKMITLMAHHLNRVWPKFDEKTFIKQATQNLDGLELKQRGDQIKRALEQCLPGSFPKAAKIMIASLHPDDDIDLSGTTMDKKGIRGWAILPMTQYVGEHGLDDFDLGMNVQKELTKRFSSEFGIRYFILNDKDRALETLTGWASDPNHHVRRLVSEGSRPRLPWAMRLPEFVENPEPLFPILELLKDDGEEYVRRSVANNLNDISKDHPDAVAKIARKWIAKASPERKRLVRHACRTLVKQGHPKALLALGYKKPQVSLIRLEVLTPVVQFGDALRFDIALNSEAKTDQNLMLDYVIHHRKANGKTTPKVFKWKSISLKASKDHKAQRKHAIRAITTRKYYAGTHRVEIIVNGESLGCQDFELSMPAS
jgi:3-methyladenine DNA glycosylase AlkC